MFFIKQYYKFIALEKNMDLDLFDLFDFIKYNFELFVSLSFAASTILPPQSTAAQAFVY